MEPGGAKADGRNLIDADKYLRGGCKEDGTRPPSVLPSDRMRGNGHQRKQRKLRLNRRNNFPRVRVPEHCKRLPRVVVASQSLQLLQSFLDRVLGKLL